MATDIKDRVQAALDESRILVLGAVVLLGFEYRAVFEPRFASLPAWARLTKLASLCAILIAFCLIVLPGAQALLGFQLSVTLMESFDDLPRSLKLAHLAGLGCIALSVVLLMTPAAYHRIVELGEATEHFHRVASRLVLAAMVPLTVGICVDLLIVTQRITESFTLGAIAAAVAALFVLGMWFGLTSALRRLRPTTV